MKMFKLAIISGVMLVLALCGMAGATATDPKTLETSLAWAQMMAEAPGNGEGDLAWSSHWRNEAGRFASELMLAQMDKKPGFPSAPAAAADPNAPFRAAPTPEENLARVPAPKVTTESDYIPKLRPGETAGVTVDYSRIESLISRPPAEPTSTAPVIPPLMGYGMAAPYMGYGWNTPWSGGWGGWGGGAWGGRSGWWAGRRSYWAPPCVLASPVYYDPYGCGGISGGFFYRSRHFGIGLRF
ncbi:MAG: hypothetical protein HZC54_12545 [Verrucomicrobia bacterium]|nr:hypothetical protein [Verrucomicrobiota bacterium]